MGPSPEPWGIRVRRAISPQGRTTLCRPRTPLPTVPAPVAGPSRHRARQHACARVEAERNSRDRQPPGHRTHARAAGVTVLCPARLPCCPRRHASATPGPPQGGREAKLVNDFYFSPGRVRVSRPIGPAQVPAGEQEMRPRSCGGPPTSLRAQQFSSSGCDPPHAARRRPWLDPVTPARAMPSAAEVPSARGATPPHTTVTTMPGAGQPSAASSPRRSQLAAEPTRRAAGSAHLALASEAAGSGEWLQAKPSRNGGS